MQDFRKKKSNKFVFLIVILLLVGFNVLIISGLGDLIRKNREARANRLVAEEELQELIARETNIIRKIEEISTPFGQEKAIRQKFSLKKPGEGEVIITDPVGEEASAARAGSFWEFLKKLLR